MDLAFRLALIICLLKRLRSGEIDIETAFLYSDLEDEIPICIPEGIVWAVLGTFLRWWTKVYEAMSECSYYLSKADPCQFIKKLEVEVTLSFVIIYNKYGRISSTPKAINKIVATLGKLM
jgi:hypothetical protein